jgi:arylsulfatase A-like enzyme
MFLYDALLHVPLLWYAPGRIARGQRTTALAQSTDFFPTLVELSGGKRPDGLPGRSLRPFLAGRAHDDPSHEIFTSGAYGEIEGDAREPDMTPRDAAARPRHTQKMNLNMRPMHRMAMARSLEWKMIVNENRGPELYKMNGGWVERENVAERREFAPVRESMEKRLRQWWTW